MDAALNKDQPLMPANAFSAAMACSFLFKKTEDGGPAAGHKSAQGRRIASDDSLISASTGCILIETVLQIVQ